MAERNHSTHDRSCVGLSGVVQRHQDHLQKAPNVAEKSLNSTTSEPDLMATPDPISAEPKFDGSPTPKTAEAESASPVRNRGIPARFNDYEL